MLINGELYKEMWLIYIRRNYTAINEITSFAATWMQLEAIILSKLTQEQKTKSAFSHLQVGTNQWVLMGIKMAMILGTTRRKSEEKGKGQGLKNY